MSGRRPSSGRSSSRPCGGWSTAANDSWGVAVSVNGHVGVEKRTGKIGGARVSLPASDIGFGHTRWATHGGVTEPNTHPHLDSRGRLAVIHNGTVENHHPLRDELAGRGHRFRTETDSEVIAHLLEDELPRRGGDLAAALRSVFNRLDGLNAVIAMDVGTRELATAKTVGVGRHGATIASDALVLLGHADRVVYLENDHLVRLGKGGLALYERATMRELPIPFGPMGAETGEAELGA